MGKDCRSVSSRAGVATKDKAPRRIVQIETPAAVVPIIDVINQFRARRVALYAYDQPTLGTRDGLGWHCLNRPPRQRAARDLTEVGDERDPPFGGRILNVLKTLKSRRVRWAGYRLLRWNLGTRGLLTCGSFGNETAGPVP